MSNGSNLRILVVDDSSLYRKIVRQALSEVPGCEVVDTAFDGLSALEQIKKHKPDLVTLDIEMPRLDGLETLKRIKAEYPKIGVIMLSALTSQGATATTQALQEGAFDFVLKPSGGSLDANSLLIANELKSKVKAFQSTLPLVRMSSARTESTDRPLSLRIKCEDSIEAVCIGVSTGGPTALGVVLPSLPKNIRVPIFVVQHMPPIFTKSLADHLNNQSQIEVCEASDMQLAKPGVAYIAPGGRQMKVHRTVSGMIIRVTDDPAEGACKPSVDFLFRSIADVYGGKALAVILTGMGQDGLAGTRLLSSKGACVIAQDQATSTVYGMPRQIVDNQLATDILPLSDIGPKIRDIASKRALACT